MTAIVPIKHNIQAMQVSHEHEWMTVFVNHGLRADGDRQRLWVELMIHSSFGSWGYLWTHCGPTTWREWLTELSCDYMMTKLMGADMYVPVDIDEAFTRLKAEAIVTLHDFPKSDDFGNRPDSVQLRSNIAAMRHDIEYDFVDDVEHLFDRWSEFTGTKYWPGDFCLTKINPTATNFWERLWRPFIAELNAADHSEPAQVAA